ncbi:MAG: hypothetical protein ACRDHY_01430 [Anaerolineales bacterium]
MRRRPAKTNPQIAPSVIGSGVVTAPGAGATIASIAAASIPKGYYDVEVALGYTGTLGAAEQNNMRLSMNGVPLAAFMALPTVGVVHIYTLRRRFTSGLADLAIQAIAAGTLGSLYYAHLIATRVSPAG